MALEQSQVFESLGEVKDVVVTGNVRSGDWIRKRCCKRLYVFPVDKA